MPISKICGFSILTTAILAGCGGSGGGSGTTASGTLASGTSSGTGQTTQPVAEPLNDPQPDPNPANVQNSEADQDDTSGTGVAGFTDGATEADDSAVETDSGITDSDSTVTENSDDSASSTDTTDTSDGSAENGIGPSAAFANSTCQPGATAVSYETYFSSGGNGMEFAFGVFVPFPASGFGWNGNQICDLEGSSGLDVIELLVPYEARRPDTDGVFNFSEWAPAASAGTYNYEMHRNRIDNLLLSPVPGYIDGTGFSRWRAMHDGTNLYLYVLVATDQISDPFLDSEELWNDDSVEIYIDGDNSKGDVYDGIDDFQVSLSVDSSIDPVISSFSPPGLGIFHRSRGLVMEIAINLESAGIEIGKPFGFDVHINEDDNGGDRDAKWGWFEKSGFDRSWQQPSVLGTVLLTDCADRNACGSFQQLSP